MKANFSRHERARALASRILTLSAVAAAALGFAPAHAQPSLAEPLPTDRLIVKYRAAEPGARAGAASADRQRLQGRAEEVARRWGQRLQHVRVAALDAHVLRLERRLAYSEVARLAREIAAEDPNVEYAEPDRILTIQMTPNDTQYGQQWQYFEPTGGLNLPPAWDAATGAGVVVAVIDTGFRPHADLAANVLPGHDFIRDSGRANDGNARDADARDPGDWSSFGACGFFSPSRSSSWHGTHVAGSIAAVTNNRSGVAGVAFDAKVLPVRVLGQCGGYTSDIADGMVWAAGGSVSGVPANPTPAKVLNLSLGGAGACDTTSQNAVNLARGRGAVVVVAAGNSNANASGFSPASCSGVIAVAATNRSGGRASYSNYGALVTVAAPGGDTRSGVANGILSTLNAGSQGPGADSYAYYQGTSMAAPHVAGVAALMLSRNPSLTPDQVAARLRSTARAFPSTCSQCGAGIVNAAAAVTAAGGDGPVPPAGNEMEPNDSTATARSSREGETITGSMASLSDNDYFRVPINPGSTLGAKLTPNGSSNYDLQVYSSGGALLASSSNGTGLLDSLAVKNNGSAQATYFVRVHFVSGGTGSTGGGYSLVID